MKNYLIIFGSISTALAFLLALLGHELGAIALCISASSSLFAGSISKPTTNLSTCEVTFFSSIGAAGQEGITIEEIKKKMKHPDVYEEISDNSLKSLIIDSEIKGFIKYKEGKLYIKR